MRIASPYVLVQPIAGVHFCADCAAAPQAVRRHVVWSLAIMFGGLMLATVAMLSVATEREKHVVAILAIDAVAVLWCVAVMLVTWIVLRGEARAFGRVSVTTPVKVIRNNEAQIVLDIKRREVVDYVLKHNNAKTRSCLVL